MKKKSYEKVVIVKKIGGIATVFIALFSSLFVI